MNNAYSKMDPKTLEVLKNAEANTPAVKQLEELKKVAKSLDSLTTYLQKQNQQGERSAGDMAELLFDVKDALEAFSDKEDPEQPDLKTPLTEALDGFKKEMASVLKQLDFKPQIKVSAPDVNVPTPKVDVNVDLKGVEKSFKEAVDSIPQPGKQKDYSKVFEKILEKLGEIDTATRMKPLPPSTMKVTNVDGSAIGGSSTTTNYAKRVEEDSGTAGIYYFGKAAIGSADADAVWQIKRIDTTTIDAETTWAEDTGTADDTFVQVWNNRESLTYS